MDITLSQDMYINLYANMAEAMLVEHQGGLIDLYVTEPNGDERFTDQAQDIFNDYCDLVEQVLSDSGIRKADS
jgi:hypothetical protein|tara:strand:- start:38 stop:256 length:219 start_codon:yes stop_codon:yes gene_type:complete